MYSRQKNALEWLNVSQQDFFVCGPKFTRLSLLNAEGIAVDHFFSDFGYLEQFRRYSRSKSKLVKNRAEFLTFFALPYFRGPAFQKLYTCYDPCLAARRMENVLWGYSHWPRSYRGAYAEF